MQDDLVMQARTERNRRVCFSVKPGRIQSTQLRPKENLVQQREKHSSDGNGDASKGVRLICFIHRVRAFRRSFTFSHTLGLVKIRILGQITIVYYTKGRKR